MADKVFKLTEDDIKELIPPMGFGFVSDKITVEGMKVGFMYREKPEQKNDSGWRFFSGTEDIAYSDDHNNIEAFDVNVIANFDPAIIPYLKTAHPNDLERVSGTDEFIIVTDE
ncbi:MAG TPA: DUF2185 domain-containing protein [Flavobacterium sp.]|nr:DUF2185 domain-containing protein [Flavobacterium sp.]